MPAPSDEHPSLKTPSENSNSDTVARPMPARLAVATFDAEQSQRTKAQESDRAWLGDRA
jgi:hypothetical protein